MKFKSRLETKQLHLSVWKELQTHFFGFGSPENNGESHYPQMGKIWKLTFPGVACQQKLSQLCIKDSSKRSLRHPENHLNHWRHHLGGYSTVRMRPEKNSFNTPDQNKKKKERKKKIQRLISHLLKNILNGPFGKYSVD